MLESLDFLEPLSGTIKRRKFCTVDIESKDEDSRIKAGFTRPFLIGTYDPQRRLYAEFADEPCLRSTRWQDRALAPGGCIGKAMAYLLSPAFSGYNIYAHNGGSFDHLFWLRWLRLHDDEFGFEVVPVQSSIQVIKVWQLPENEEDPIKNRWTFLDSMKLFPSGLEKMCKTFGLPGKVEQDLDVDEDDPSWSIYLKQDCIALADGLAKIHDLVENKLGGEVGMTAPSTSMKLFRRRFLGQKGSVKRIPRFAHWPECVNKDTCLGCAHEWIRKGYYGGRTELFRTFGEKLQYFDINSSYVAAMREEMPVGDRMITNELDWDMAKTHGGFVECVVEIPSSCELPPLPYRAKKTGKLIFPTGRFSGVWTTKELALLSHPAVNGKILSVKKVVWFRLKEVFTGMVDTLWALRSKCLQGCKTQGCKGCNPDYDEGLSALAKLLGNSLYGKWAMRHERTSIVFSNFKDTKHCFLCQEECEEGLCKDCEGSKPASENSGDVWYKANKVEAAYIIPHISSWITSLARIRLWMYMRQAVEAGGTIYYADTDSILTDVSLPSSNELGGLKNEYPGHTLTGTFVQPKVYMLESDKLSQPKVTMKGFPYRNTDSEHKACACVSCVSGETKHKKSDKAFKSCECPQCIIRCKENLLKLQAGETLEWRQLEKIRTLASMGFKRGPMMRTVKKSFKTKYDKRVIQADGVSTMPVVIDEDEEERLEAAE